MLRHKRQITDMDSKSNEVHLSTMAYLWSCPGKPPVVLCKLDAEDAAGIPMCLVCNRSTSPGVWLEQWHEAQAGSCCSSGSANNMIINGAPVGGKAGYHA